MVPIYAGAKNVQCAKNVQYAVEIKMCSERRVSRACNCSLKGCRDKREQKEEQADPADRAVGPMCGGE